MSTRRATRRTPAPAAAEVEVQEVVTVETRSTRTRAPRKTAPAPSKTSKAATGKGKGKEAAAAAAATTTATATAAATETETPATKVNAATTTTTTTATSSRATRPDAVASTPGPSTTGKRRLRSTTEAESPLRTLDDQPPPSKRKRTTSGKTQTPAAAHAPERSTPGVEEGSDDEETPVFFTKKFEPTAREIQLSEQRDRITSLEETLISEREDCAHLRNKRDDARGERDKTRAELDEARAEFDKVLVELHKARAELDEARVEISRLYGRILEVELNKYETPRKNDGYNTGHQTDAPVPEFDSFDVDESESAKAAFMTGDESAHALLRHVQEAARGPMSTSQSLQRVELRPSTSPVKSAAVSPERPFTPSRSMFSSFVASPLTAIKNLFGSSTYTPTPPTPTPSRRPPQDSMTEVLTIPPTPVGERPKRSNHKPRKHNRLVKTLLRGIEPEDAEKATAWAEQVAAELQKDRAAGDKRKRIQAPVLFRDLKHLPSSKPWESGFSFPEDVLDLEDDDVVPAWAVYTSMVEELQHMPKRTKTAHVICEDDDLPASLNQLFATPTPSLFSTPTTPKPKPHSGSEPFYPRRSIDPSPMFDAPLHHQEGVNVFKELHGHDTAVNDRENLQRERKADEVRKPTNNTTANNAESTPKAHDPSHGSFSVPDSDSEDEEGKTQPVWTQPPPPTPTPAHTSLPNANNNDEVEKQRQKLMKHTPHKPSRLQQVSYPSPSLMSDAGESPLRNVPAESPLKASAQLFGDIPEVEPVDFSDDPEVAAAMASPSYRLRVQEQLQKWAHWSPPEISYESEEEEISPV